MDLVTLTDHDTIEGAKKLRGIQDLKGTPTTGLTHPAQEQGRRQQQRSGQPLRNTVVRIPGPSSVENLWMLKTSPVTAFMSQPAPVSSSVPRCAR